MPAAHQVCATLCLGGRVHYYSTIYNTLLQWKNGRVTKWGSPGSPWNFHTAGNAFRGKVQFWQAFPLPKWLINDNSYVGVPGLSVWEFLGVSHVRNDREITESCVSLCFLIEFEWGIFPVVYCVLRHYGNAYRKEKHKHTIPGWDAHFDVYIGGFT